MFKTADQMKSERKLPGIPAKGTVRFTWLLSSSSRRLLVFLLLAAVSLIPSASSQAATNQLWTLESAIAKALSDNPSAAIAQHRIRQAEALRGQANAAFWPQVAFNSSYTRLNHPVGVFGAALNQQSFSPALDFNDVPDADNLNVNGVVTVPLYRGGQNKALKRSAQAGLQASQMESQAVRYALALEVARAYYTSLKTLDFARAAEAAVKSLESNLKIAGQRWEGGAALKTDVLDIEVRLAQAREDLVRVRNAYALSLRALANLLGIEKEEIAIESQAPTLPLPEAATQAKRPELAAVRYRIQGAQSDVRRAQGGYYPHVDAFGRYDYDHGWRFNGSGDSYTAGVMLRWNIWDGRLTRSKVDESEARLEMARQEERQQRLAIDYEIQQARLALSEAEGRLAVTEKVVSQAEESAALQRSRFEQGLVISSQLLDSETALTAARVRRAEAMADRQISIAALRKALGLSLLPLPGEPK